MPARWPAPALWAVAPPEARRRAGPTHRAEPGRGRPPAGPPGSAPTRPAEVHPARSRGPEAWPACPSGPLPAPAGRDPHAPAPPQAQLPWPVGRAPIPDWGWAGAASPLPPPRLKPRAGLPAPAPPRTPVGPGYQGMPLPKERKGCWRPWSPAPLLSPTSASAPSEGARSPGLAARRVHLALAALAWLLVVAVLAEVRQYTGFLTLLLETLESPLEAFVLRNGNLRHSVPYASWPIRPW